MNLSLSTARVAAQQGYIVTPPTFWHVCTTFQGKHMARDCSSTPVGSEYRRDLPGPGKGLHQDRGKAIAGTVRQPLMLSPDHLFANLLSVMIVLVLLHLHPHQLCHGDMVKSRACMLGYKCSEHIKQPWTLV
jgi:hypothetical protein